MNCNISGQVCEQPVVSAKSGAIFEKRLIRGIIQSQGRDPVSNDPLTEDDLIDIKLAAQPAKPRPTAATSIPGMLALFQNEWDAVMLESFNLKQHLDSVRQELSHALYQHDAACRVIARLIKERDEARNALSAFQANGASAPADAMEVEAGLSKAIVDRLVQTSQKLSKSRKGRKPAPGTATPQDIASYGALTSHAVHKASQPGITCVDIHPTQQDSVVTGGADHSVVVFNRSTSKVQATLTGHGKKITDVTFHPSKQIIFSASEDKSAGIWVNSDGRKYELQAQLKDHTDAVNAIALHPSGDFLITASSDKSWGFYDVETASLAAKQTTSAGLTKARFHPDGLILGTGCSDSVVRLFDVKSLAVVAELKDLQGPTAALAFSENGYYVSAAAANTATIWDLRKLNVVKALSFAAPVTSLDFDYSGQYLAVGSNDIQVIKVKEWGTLATFTEHTGVVTGVRWGLNAQWLASSSLDRSLRFWGSK